MSHTRYVDANNSKRITVLEETRQTTCRSVSDILEDGAKYQICKKVALPFTG